MKFSVRPQFRRLHDLLDRIRKDNAIGVFPNCSVFAQSFEVSRYTILRDLDFLRDEWGAPIEYDASRKGYFLSDPAWTVPAVKLDRREVFALGVARKIMSAFRGTPLEADMQSALAKMSDTLEGHISLEPSVMTEQISVVVEDYAPQNPDTWMAAARYAHHRQRITMRYRRFDGQVGTYTLDPVHLAAYHGEWYLMAYYAQRKKIASFAMSRILSLRGTGERFAEPAPGLVRRALDERFGIMGGETLMDVHLRFTPAVAAYIAGRIWHPSQTVRQRRDGSVDLRIKTRGWKELVRFVLSWQPDAIVLKPTALRDRVREKLQCGLDRLSAAPRSAVLGSPSP